MSQARGRGGRRGWPRPTGTGRRRSGPGLSRRSCSGARAGADRGAAVDRLTRREKQCLALVAQGETNEGIADRLELTTETVRSHLNHVYQRLDVQDAGNPRVLAAVRWVREASKEGS